MTHKRILFLLFALIWLGSASLAQEKSPRDRLTVAHAMYYTPTASGLTSFHCDAAIDWKEMLTRFGGKEIPDDNPALIYLKTVHLSVANDLRGKGSLEWASTAEPPAGREDALKRMREGLQTSVAGFFQSWNAYTNGSMVPIPDSTLEVTKSGEGVHLSGTFKSMKIDEDFDKNMLLTQAQVVSPDMKVLAIPTYVGTADGLLVSAVVSHVNQPLTAPEVETTFRVEYAKVDSFQIPSHLILDIKNTGVIEIGFSGCEVVVADWAKAPKAH